MKNKSFLLIIFSILVISTVSIIYLAILRQPKSDSTKDNESDTELTIQDNETDKYADINDEDYKHLMNVQRIQEIISELRKSKKFQKSKTEDRLKLTEDLMKELVEKKMIKDYKIDLSNGVSKPLMLYYFNDEDLETLMRYEEQPFPYIIYDYNSEGYVGVLGIIRIFDFAKDQN